MSNDKEKIPLGDKVFLYVTGFLLLIAIVACSWAIFSPGGLFFLLIVLFPIAVGGIAHSGVIPRAWAWAWATVSNFFRPLKRVRNLSSGQQMLLFLGIAFTIAGVFPYTKLMTTHCFIIDPFLDLRWYSFYVGALLVGGSLILFANSGRQALERARVRKAILRELQLSTGEEGLRLAREGTLALVRCAGSRLQGRLAELGGRRLWLCFLSGRLLVISGKTGAVVSLNGDELRKIDLLDHGTGDDFRLAMRTGTDGVLFKLNRLENVGRVVNVLIQRGVVLGFQAAARLNLRTISALAMLLVAVIAGAAVAWRPHLLDELPHARRATWKLGKEIPFDAYISGLGDEDQATISPDGKLLATCFDSHIEIWSLFPRPSLLCDERLSTHPSIHNMTFSPDGTRLVYSCDGKLLVRTVPAERFDLSQTFTDKLLLEDAESHCLGLAFSTDCKRLAWSSVQPDPNSGTVIHIWDLPSGRDVFTFQQPARAKSLAVSSDFKWLASVGSDDTVFEIWNMTSGRQERILQGHRGPIRHIVFSPDGRYLAASQQGVPNKIPTTVTVWSWPEGQRKFFLAGVDGRRLTFSPDGKWLAADNGMVWDLTSKPWEVSPDWRSQTLHEYVSRMKCLVFSQDGRRIITVPDRHSLPFAEGYEGPVVFPPEWKHEILQIWERNPGEEAPHGR